MRSIVAILLLLSSLGYCQEAAFKSGNEKVEALLGNILSLAHSHLNTWEASSLENLGNAQNHSKQVLKELKKYTRRLKANKVPNLKDLQILSAEFEKGITLLNTRWDAVEEKLETKTELYKAFSQNSLPIELYLEEQMHVILRYASSPEKSVRE